MDKLLFFEANVGTKRLLVRQVTNKNEIISFSIPLQEVFSLIERETPDVVVANISLSGISCEELIGFVRNNLQLQQTRVFLSGFTTPSNEEFEEKPDGYLFKPFSLENF